MAATTDAPRQTLFLRNATGLVKAWSTFDAFLYAFWSVNLVTLGLYGMSFVYTIPDGQLLGAVLLTGVLVTFLVLTYAQLVSAMPRAGGDYAWQSRILGGGVGFVLAITGWWFTLWLWTPIYANILIVQFFAPLAYTLGWSGVATFFGSHTGIFVSCLIVLAFVSWVITLGMEGYAKIQRFCFWLGMGGLLVMLGLLLFSTHQAFVDAFNREAGQLFGATGNAYQATIDASTKGGGPTGVSFGNFGFASTLLLLPFLAFYLLWPVWGATLYGEVRGAKEYRKVFNAMFWGLWITVALVAVIILLIVKTIGWDFYYAANAAYWNSIFVAGSAAPPVPIWPYPVMLAGWLVSNHLFQALLIAVLGTVVAAAIMPWRRKDIFENSPIARFRIAGIPVITITGVVSAIFLVFMLAEWSFNAVYGTSFSLNASSPIYFGVTYLAAIVIYLVARTVRKRQGIDLSRIHREIPVE